MDYKERLVQINQEIKALEQERLSFVAKSAFCQTCGHYFSKEELAQMNPEDYYSRVSGRKVLKVKCPECNCPILYIV